MDRDNATFVDLTKYDALNMLAVSSNHADL